MARFLIAACEWFLENLPAEGRVVFGTANHVSWIERILIFVVLLANVRSSSMAGNIQFEIGEYCPVRSKTTFDDGAAPRRSVPAFAVGRRRDSTRATFVGISPMDDAYAAGNCRHFKPAMNEDPSKDETAHQSRAVYIE